MDLNAPGERPEHIGHRPEEPQDPRTDSWFLVRSPLAVTLLLAVYLLLVVAGPRLMSNREALSLAGPLAAYNLGLVVLSGYMFYEFMATSLLASYSYLCQPVDYSRSELGMRMASVCWWCFFSKAVELLDTVFFILRKRPEQVTFLHVYHHSTMLFNWWAGVKYVPGGQAFFVGMLNSLVHVFMYLYYGLASLGPRLRPSLWWKRHLTILQLGQFVAIAAHSSYNLFAECPFPDGFNVAVLLYSLSLLALFLNFYQQTYLRSKQKRLAQRAGPRMETNKAVPTESSHPTWAEQIPPARGSCYEQGQDAPLFQSEQTEVDSAS